MKKNKLNALRIDSEYTWRTFAGVVGNIRYFFKSFKWAAQRVARGYSDRDLYEIDDYLSLLLPDMLRTFANVTHTYPDKLPGGYECNIENWRAYLRDAAMRIESDDIKEIQTGLKMIGDMYFELWD